MIKLARAICQPFRKRLEQTEYSEEFIDIITLIHEIAPPPEPPTSSWPPGLLNQNTPRCQGLETPDHVSGPSLAKRAAIFMTTDHTGLLGELG